VRCLASQARRICRLAVAQRPLCAEWDRGERGTATFTVTLRSNDSGATRQLTFFSDKCKGTAAAMGDIHFAATLLELSEEDWDSH